MKKIKWLTVSVLLTPVVSLLPIVSCNKKTSDINISSEFSKYVDVTPISESLEIGETYMVKLAIKQDQIGKQYLPNNLTKVLSGDKEIYSSISESTNGLADYYSYTTYENNTVAILWVYVARGPITVEANTSALKSVNAIALDITSSGIAEFEVDETLNNDTSRVVATATLENGNSFILTSEYTISLDNYQTGYRFTSADKGKTGTGTVTYNGVTSSAFNYKVNAKTVAWMKKELITTDITKYESIEKAVEAYNNSTTWGKYTIYIGEGTYNFSGDAPLTITQSQGKYLTIEASQDPYYENEQMVYSVVFNHAYTASDQSLIKIEADADTSMSSIDIRGIKFNSPTTTATLTDPVVYDIYLDTTTNAPHNITIKHCKFLGDEEKATIVNAIGTNTTTTPSKSPSNIYIGSCIGQYLNELYDGYVGHDASSSSYDLAMYGILLEDSRQLFNIYGSEVVNLIDEVRAYLMYDTEATTDMDAGMVINGTGTYDIRNCSFNQLTPLKSSTNIAGFVKTNVLTGATGSTKQINLYGTSFNLSKEETGTKLHCIWNGNDTQDDDWSLSLTHKSGLIENATIYGKDDGTNHNYWDAE